MNTKYLKISLTLLFACILNASTWALAIVNDGIYNSSLLPSNTRLSLNKSSNFLLNSDFDNFMQRITAVKRVNLNNFDTYSALIKPIDNVKVFPNPVSTQINITYTLSKDNHVVIKVLDVLGSEVLLLLNQKLQAGEQTNSFVINSKIPAGLYFIRIVSGSDSVIKRISVI